MKCITLLLSVFAAIYCEESLEIIAKTRSPFLQKYEIYMDVVIQHFEIPKGVSLVAFKFVGDEARMSVFQCSARPISMYLKYKSIPVINPDGSKFPDSFKNITRTEQHYIELLSDKTANYFNITSPEPGSYYIAAFLPYSDPKHQAIQPPGLTPKCGPFVDFTVYVKRAQSVTQVVEAQHTQVEIPINSSALFKFYVPELVTHAVLLADNITFSENLHNLIIKIQAKSLPSNGSFLESTTLEPSQTYIIMPFNTKTSAWHYLEFTSLGGKSELNFLVKYFYEDFHADTTNNTRIFLGPTLATVSPYQQYDLIRESSGESFAYSYELSNQLEISPMGLAINLTNQGFAMLKFRLGPSDIGGTLHVIFAFKPRIDKALRLTTKEPEAHKLVACVRPEVPEIPTWPNQCEYKYESINSSLILNQTTTNSSMMIPFPESGEWYATFKLFCGDCTPCNCSNDCEKLFKSCVENCESKCEGDANCYNCSIDCKAEIINRVECGQCDCDGPCLRTGETCNTSILFDISSTACSNQCGSNGRCMFMVSEGIVYSTCVCSNNYRGWDCSDNSQTTAYFMVVLELLLLVLSNLMFLPTVFIAYRRKYYTEAIVYFSICVFSTFYHACDAGENIISFCVTRLGPLQFGDFFCALLSIWVTLIAIADLPDHWPTICHTTGAIILSFITTINKTAVWVFVIPAGTGLLIIGVSWFFKWRKVRQSFVDRRYIRIYAPLGAAVVIVGLVIYAFLETANNYKYLHSMWHIIMAIAVIILLPREDTFQPQTVL